MDFPKHFLKTERYKIIPWTTTIKTNNTVSKRLENYGHKQPAPYSEPLEFGDGRAAWHSIYTLDPTFNIYEASRDLHRARRAEWHEDYTLPSLWRFYQPSQKYLTDRTGISGVQNKKCNWKKNFDLWMAFVNEYKNRGGRVTTGSDSGFIFQLYGFAYVRELELLREAGFHPLEVIRSATLNGAEASENGRTQIGSIEVGKLSRYDFG